MITPLTIYLINLSDSLIVFFSILSGLFLFMAFHTIVEASTNSYNITIPFEGLDTIQKKRITIYIISFIISLILVFILPNKETLYEMFIIPKLANNKQLQNITANGLDAVDSTIKKYIKNLNDENK